MSVDNKNKPAFAAKGKYHFQEGLTKREYFAAMAMQGILSNALIYQQVSLSGLEKDEIRGSWNQYVAEVSLVAINMADKILSEL